MDFKKLIELLGFVPKEGAQAVYRKSYASCGGYCIEVDTAKQTIDYGLLIKAESKATLNFTQDENWVVLECIDRLLTKGYQPQHIVLEKTWATGHGTSGRLDILVTREDGTAYLMIECKTSGKEFEKAFNRMEKDGGQLFTYFQQDRNADILMLYASKLQENKIEYRNEIVKIEDYYRTAGNVEDLFDRWNKVSNTNGIFDAWVSLYDFQNKLLTKKDLKTLSDSDSSFIFHQFLAILRKHSVSDKPNAFNKIFNLFLAKIYDEQENEDTDHELKFQWKEKKDNPVDFQIRLINLHKAGLLAFLHKEIEGLEDSDFESKNEQEIEKRKKKWLKFNKIFDIKDVVDDESFDDNFRVLKEVVQLLEKYQVRYPRKQQHLSDFFERLLTTGLKQEAGQYFTPPPVTKFIVKSLPLLDLMNREINQVAPKLPAVIDYAAGSGHFVTEIMEAYQDMIHSLDIASYLPNAVKKVNAWREDPYSWAATYVYGIEKDYRLVKVAKVGCYFYGDGLAQIFHADGLDSFTKSNAYDGLLKGTPDNPDNPKFSIVVSNPPYSVTAFKGDTKNIDKNDFALYESLTDRSSEIECLFVERTKQLLKEGGIAGIILPSSILSNTGIYTKTREILFKNFEIIAIAELGSNTFMATGTNTVVLFLKKRTKKDKNGKTIEDYKNAVDDFSQTLQDKTINGIEKPVTQYISHVWEGISFEDYVSLMKKQPNETVKKHEIFKDYDKKIKAKNEAEKLIIIVEKELEKIFYFILAFPQKNVVIVKSGDKDIEKRFLGYEFSNRRGSEGMHPIQRGKTIDECTQLFDNEQFENPEKVSSYIYQAFKGNHSKPIHLKLEKHVFRMDLVDMMTFDRVDFEKNISLAIKKKMKVEDIWGTKKLQLLSDISNIVKGTSITKEKTKQGSIPVIAGGQEIAYYHNESNRQGNVVTVSASGAYSGFVNYFEMPVFASDCNTVQSKNEDLISTKLIYLFLKSIQNEIYKLQKGQAQPHVYGEDLAQIKIPLPPKDIQEKIVSEIEVLEEKERKVREIVKSLKNEIATKFNTNTTNNDELLKLGEACEMKAGQFVKVGDISEKNQLGLYPCYGGNGLRGYVKTYTHEGIYPLIGRQGALCGNVHLVNGKFHATEHALVATPKMNIDVIWLYHKLVSMNLNQFATGTAQPGLSVINLTPIQISIPSLSEQQKIASEIEKIGTEIVILEKKLAEIPKQKEDILRKYL